MRWTIRGIPSETADAVRDLAYETGSSLGEVLTLCVRHGLLKTRNHLEAEANQENEIDALLREIKDVAEAIQVAHASQV